MPRIQSPLKRLFIGGSAPWCLSRQVACLVPCDEGLDVLPVDEHFPADLDVWQSSTPDLTAPEPFGSAELLDQFLDSVKSLVSEGLRFCNGHDALQPREGSGFGVTS